MASLKQVTWCWTIQRICESYSPMHVRRIVVLARERKVGKLPGASTPLSLKVL